MASHWSRTTPRTTSYSRGCSERIASHTIGDIRDADTMRLIASQADPHFVFHLAAQALVRRSYREPIETFDTNVMGTVNVLDALRYAPSLRSAVVVTSDKCYDNRELERGYTEDDSLGGRDPYSASKGCTELVTRSYRDSFFEEGPGIASARAGNVIGGGDRAEDRIVPDFVRALEDGDALLVRNPGAVRPWQHVLEPLFGYLLLAARLAEDPAAFGRAYNFGPDEAAQVSVRELVDILVETYGGSWDDGSGADAPHEATLLTLDATRARTELGWAPLLDVQEAVEYTGRWYAEAEAGHAWDVTVDQIATYAERASADMPGLAEGTQ